MKKRKIAFGIVLNILFSVIMAAVMGLAAASIDGQSVTWESFAFGFGVGFVINFVVSSIVPLQKIGQGFSRALGATSVVAQHFVQPLIWATIFVLILIFCFTAIQTGFGNLESTHGTVVTFMDRYLSGLGFIWLIAYVAVLFTMPFSFWAARKITGFSSQDT
ncbi:MAG: hypothetical protein LBU07_07290 [Coriobacteriales bacterium]|jgi:hypothetical protein|nr:hypothetical protein [Coriobacteriales bacterium]